MQQAFQIRPRPMYQREKPERNPKYTRFVKNFPCAACGQNWNVDPCHTGPHGQSQKSSDFSCIPLCRKCHDAFDADPRGFAEEHQLNVPALVARLNQAWALSEGGLASAAKTPEADRAKYARISGKTNSFDLGLSVASATPQGAQPTDSAAEGDLLGVPFRPLSGEVL